jgi:2'-5' RNA ligase
MFVALQPDEASRRRLYSLAKTVAAVTSGRTIPQQNLHLTLIFLGSIGPTVGEHVQAAASVIRSEPFELEIDRLMRKSDMVWAVASAAPAPLLALHLALAGLNQDRGSAASADSFIPHITLVRKIEPHLSELPEIESTIRCRFSEFVLMSSQTLPEGSQYKVCNKWALK